MFILRLISSRMSFVFCHGHLPLKIKKINKIKKTTTTLPGGELETSDSKGGHFTAWLYHLATLTAL